MSEPNEPEQPDWLPDDLPGEDVHPAAPDEDEDEDDG